MMEEEERKKERTNGHETVFVCTEIVNQNGIKR